jgi:hypothetical protein
MRATQIHPLFHVGTAKMDLRRSMRGMFYEMLYELLE